MKPKQATAWNCRQNVLPLVTAQYEVFQGKENTDFREQHSHTALSLGFLSVFMKQQCFERIQCKTLGLYNCNVLSTNVLNETTDSWVMGLNIPGRNEWKQTEKCCKFHTHCNIAAEIFSLSGMTFHTYTHTLTHTHTHKHIHTHARTHTHTHKQTHTHTLTHIHTHHTCTTHTQTQTHTHTHTRKTFLVRKRVIFDTHKQYFLRQETWEAK